MATFQYLLHVLALLALLVGSFPFVFSTLLHHWMKTVFALLSERFPTSSSPGEYLPSKLPISLLYLSQHRALSQQGPIGSCRRFRILLSAFVLLFWSKENEWYSCRLFRLVMSSKRSRVGNELPISRRCLPPFPPRFPPRFEATLRDREGTPPQTPPSPRNTFFVFLFWSSFSS